MLRILQKRERFFLYVIFGLLFSSLLFNFIAYPFWQKNQRLNSEITRTRLKLIKYLEVLNKKDRLESKNLEPAPALGAFEQKEDSVVSVLAQLGLLSQQANVKILDIRPQGLGTAAKAQEATFDLRLEGDIEGYLKFIYEIENSVFLLRIKKILLHAKADSPSLEGAFTILQTFRN